MRNLRLSQNSNKVDLDQPRPPGGGRNLAHSTTDCVDVTFCDRTDALVRGLDLVVKHHKLSYLTRCELKGQIHHYLDSSSSETIWLQRAKYLLCRPLAEYLGNPLPAEPDLVYKFTGGLKRWWKNRIRVFNRANSHLWYSWLQCKRCTLPVSKEMVEAAYLKHCKVLTSPDVGDSEVIDSIFEDRTFKKVLARVRSSVTKNFELSHNHAPSYSASFESSRAKGGQAGSLKLYSGLDKDIPFGTELVKMTFHPRVAQSGIILAKTLEYRAFTGESEWKDFWVDKTYEFFDREALSCTIQAILEPMKIRLISKGESIPYYLCKPLQKAIHTSMRDMPAFRLIGRPFCPTDLMGISRTAHKDWEWFSIDYSAATDQLSWLYSGRIFRDIISDLPEDVQNLANLVLGPHDLFYPEGKEIVKRGTQSNGQLMGSILSFPILCLANLGVYLYTTRELHRCWPSSARLESVLINGDDMLYCAPSYLWSEHIKNGQSVGLEMSLGKAYHHPIYSNVNSVSCHYDLSQRSYPGSEDDEIYLNWGSDNTPWRIDFLNTGLFFGQHKVQGRDETACEHSLATETTLATCLNVVLQGCLPGRQGEVLAEYLSIHKEALAGECTVYIGSKPYIRNLFLPVSSGGMGVEAPVNWRFQVTSHQKLLYNLSLPSHTFCRGSPALGWSVQEEETMVMTPWNTFKVEKLPFEPKEYWFLRSKKQLWYAKREKMLLQIFPYDISKFTVTLKA